MGNLVSGLTLVLKLLSVAILTITYEGELLYFARSFGVIVARMFYCMVDNLNARMV